MVTVKPLGIITESAEEGTVPESQVPVADQFPVAMAVMFTAPTLFPIPTNEHSTKKKSKDFSFHSFHGISSCNCT